eukprot:2706662-Pyramimonas_sp.AAC.1
MDRRVGPAGPRPPERVSVFGVGRDPRGCRRARPRTPGVDALVPRPVRPGALAQQTPGLSRPRRGARRPPRPGTLWPAGAAALSRGWQAGRRSGRWLGAGRSAHGRRPGCAPAQFRCLRWAPS